MKIALYSPYVPKHTGGGERYFFDVARILSQQAEVTVGIPHLALDKVEGIRQRYESFLGQSLARIHFAPTPLGTDASFLEKLLWTRQFDVMYHLTDGSLFFSLASRNILHIQFPLKLDKSAWLEQVKLKNWQVKNTNSAFTKTVVEQSWPTKIDVIHYPLIELADQLGEKVQPQKEKVILSVGRFFRQLHAKRQDVLINMLRELRRREPKLSQNWRLVLVGAVEDDGYLKELHELAAGLPVTFLHDITREALVAWYQKASFYWHAAGFGVDESLHPEKVEHFGISLVEAMAAGAIPLAIAKGGPVEILSGELQKNLWHDPSDCVSQMQQLWSQPEKQQAIRQAARLRARDFGYAQFESKLWYMVTGKNDDRS